MNARPAAAAAAPARILLVDDDPTNLRVLVETLRGEGFSLLTARSGEAALTAMRRAVPDLVLLDIVMPEMDGYQVCEAVKEDPALRDVPIILLSALGDTESKVRGFDTGAVDYVSKPFEPREVIARVNTHLTVHRLQRSLADANRRMRRDLNAAARIQRGLLPQSVPVVAEAQFAWRYQPCDELAGDSFNVYRLDERHVGIYVLDVCGHGVPSALLSTAVTRSLTPREDSTSLVLDRLPGGGTRIASPSRVMGQLNAMYPMDTDGMPYFTIVYGILDLRAGSFRFASAGHPGPMVMPADGAPSTTEATGIPIGILENTPYYETELQLQPGDRFFLYSDGVYEERDDAGEQFGLDRIMSSFAAQRGQSLDTGVSGALDAVMSWGGRDGLTDDAVLLGVEWSGPAG